jgi:hypothetical protein
MPKTAEDLRRVLYDDDQAEIESTVRESYASVTKSMEGKSGPVGILQKIESYGSNGIVNRATRHVREMLCVSWSACQRPRMERGISNLRFVMLWPPP